MDNVSSERSVEDTGCKRTVFDILLSASWGNSWCNSEKAGRLLAQQWKEGVSKSLWYMEGAHSNLSEIRKVVTLAKMWKGLGGTACEEHNHQAKGVIFTEFSTSPRKWDAEYHYRRAGTWAVASSAAQLSDFTEDNLQSMSWTNSCSPNFQHMVAVQDFNFQPLLMLCVCTPCACDSIVRQKIKNSSAFFHFENKDVVVSCQLELDYENTKPIWKQCCAWGIAINTTFHKCTSALFLCWLRI